MEEEIATAIPQLQGSSTKKRGSREKVWVEEYLHLLHSRQTLHLTINQLNQVPSILCTFQFSFLFSNSLSTLCISFSQHTATGHPHSRLQENSPRSQGSILHHANLKFCFVTNQNFAEKRCLFSPFSS